jgi:hypothetical protein
MRQSYRGWKDVPQFGPVNRPKGGVPGTSIQPWSGADGKHGNLRIDRYGEAFSTGGAAAVHGLQLWGVFRVPATGLRPNRETIPGS